MPLLGSLKVPLPRPDTRETQRESEKERFRNRKQLIWIRPSALSISLSHSSSFSSLFLLGKCKTQSSLCRSFRPRLTLVLFFSLCGATLLFFFDNKHFRPAVFKYLFIYNTRLASILIGHKYDKWLYAFVWYLNNIYIYIYILGLHDTPVLR